jgi:predicted GH43/DUF377 family glycosyl hydrolase
MKRRLLFEKGGWFVFNPAAVEQKTLPGLISPQFNKVHIYYRQCDSANFSSIYHCVLSNSKLTCFDKPVLFKQHDYEYHGVEDPHITKIGSVYYMVYVAYDGKTARVALAESKDLVNFKKHGLIGPDITYREAARLADSPYYGKVWKLKEQNKIIYDKDAMLFPKKINGKYALLHRLDPAIQIVYFDEFSDLKKKSFWKEHIKNIHKYTLMKPKYSWEQTRIGAGCILETKKGWLLFYHGIKGRKHMFEYAAGLALLDRKDPMKVIARLEKPLFSPEYKWEKQGQIPNVVFPTRAILQRGIVRILYGCSDTRIGLAEITLEELFKKLKVK